MWACGNPRPWNSIESTNSHRLLLRPFCNACSKLSHVFQFFHSTSITSVSVHIIELESYCATFSPCLRALCHWIWPEGELGLIQTDTDFARSGTRYRLIQTNTDWYTPNSIQTDTDRYRPPWRKWYRLIQTHSDWNDTNWYRRIHTAHWHYNWIA